jgi:LysR family cys regulon transcriptional activator
LASISAPTLEDVAAYPIVTYVFSFTGPSSLHEAFSRAGLHANVALTAHDADVIKTYVRLGLGVGIIAGVALDPIEDDDLVAIDAVHLFPAHQTWIGFARDGLLRRYMYDFITLLAPHIDRALVDRATESDTQEQVDALFSRVSLTER